MKQSHTLAVGISIGLIFGLIVSNCSVFPWHWVKIASLRHVTKGDRASLWRLDGGFDGAYKIELNGFEIWRCGDTVPQGLCSHREVLDWDASGKLLVFELARVIVFAYDLDTSREVPPDQFVNIVLPTNDLRRIQYCLRHQLPGYVDEDSANNGPSVQVTRDVQESQTNRRAGSLAPQP